jgi:hypothetical protein
MGEQGTESTTVVDESLCVWGVQGLRVTGESSEQCQFFSLPTTQPWPHRLFAHSVVRCTNYKRLPSTFFSSFVYFQLINSTLFFVRPDASVIPLLPAGDVRSTVVMIGAAAAEIVLTEAKIYQG